MKCGNVVCDTQFAVQGQWWSILGMQVRQDLQWCARGGLGVEHFLHHFLLLMDFSFFAPDEDWFFSAQSFGMLPGLTNTACV